AQWIVCRPASSTCLARGAAVSPPAPALTSSTQTATRGCRAGAKAANQASVLLPSASLLWHPSLPSRLLVSDAAPGAHSVFSSAVPVLPATVTPAIAAAVPVPSRTTPIISRRAV